MTARLVEELEEACADLRDTTDTGFTDVEQQAICEVREIEGEPLGTVEVEHRQDHSGGREAVHVQVNGEGVAFGTQNDLDDVEIRKEFEWIEVVRKNDAGVQMEVVSVGPDQGLRAGEL